MHKNIEKKELISNSLAICENCINCEYDAQKEDYPICKIDNTKTGLLRYCKNHIRGGEK